MLALKPVKSSYLIAPFILYMLLIVSPGNVKAQSKLWPVPSDAASIKNPIASSPEVLKNAKVTYVSYCTPCHGNKGKGDGAAAAGLATKPADHSSDLVQKQTDGALYWMITSGRNPMPGYKAGLTDAQRWQLVDYIRTLAKTKK